MNYQFLIIGFGKAGKTFAVKAKKLGYKVALIEKNPQMFGGTCINVGCIPTKTLKHRAEKNVALLEAIQQKNQFIGKLRNKNQAMLENNDVPIIVGEARLIDAHTVKVNEEIITAEKIIINTGSLPVTLHFEGNQLPNVYDSTTIMEATQDFEHLVIIGGGYIGLEMANIFATFNKKVTVLERGAVLAREDDDVKQAIVEAMHNVTIIENCTLLKYDGQQVHYETANGVQTITADALLVAASRKANTANLGLENTNVTLNERGEIIVNEHLQTTQENIYAVGDVRGGLNFTYTSLDDYRILCSNFFNQEQRTTNNRGAIPYSLFIHPVFSSVGLNEKQAKAKNIPVKIAKFQMANSPRANITQQGIGMMKAVIHSETNEILGAALLCVNSEEIINLIKMAIDLKLPYHYFENMIFTHPSISENLNDLFQSGNIQ